ncbi:MAG: sensor histidine kinase KdpD [Clostridiales bacterium]|nr:sensor histidine kinase KdpD [Clostridiales bacterium]
MRVKRRGQLYIFFSYAEGTGKTQAMLRAVQEAARRGESAAVACTQPEEARRLGVMGRGLARIEPRELRSGGQTAWELDLDAALERRPDALAVGGLGHVNAQGCRHERRDQDVQELLRAGVNVYATLNVGQLEGMRGEVSDAAQAMVPDAVFDGAAQVVMVDREPAALLQAARGEKRSLEELTALRELALRRCADRLALCARGLPPQRGDVPPGREHILVCLSSAPSNARVIRMASRMAGAFRCALTALFVRTAGHDRLGEEDRKRLKDNMRLAGQLGANVQIVVGEDVAYQIAEYARVSGVSQIVLGRSAMTLTGLWRRPSITDRLVQLAPGIEMHILPDGETQASVLTRLSRLRLPHVSASDFVKTLAIFALATALSLAFYELDFSEANIIMAYILGVLLTAVTTSNRLCSSITSIASVFIFNYLFTEPRFTLRAYDTGYPVTFIIMLLAALMTGSLAARLKHHAQESAQTAYRTRVLFETNQQLSQASGRDAILAATAEQLIKLFKRNVIVYSVMDGELAEGKVFPAQPGGNADALGQERRVAEWALRSNRQAGASTDTFAQAQGLYLTVRLHERIYAVVGIATGADGLGVSGHGMLLAILGECALALENERNVREKEAAAMQARTEQLRADLLRAISHDLRTPLTAISGNASNLLASADALDEETRRQIYADIHDDALWLINLVENLLYVTRIEDGRMKLRLCVELMDEVMQEALRHETCKGRDHVITLRSSEEMLLARIDARLIIQVILNLVDNAIKYTPPGSHIELSARREGTWICVRCADDGPGVPDAEKPRVFEMFYSGGQHCADSRRSLGLGLGLCKSIVNAHGGTIRVSDNQPCGAVFEFTVPAEEVELSE